MLANFYLKKLANTNLVLPRKNLNCDHVYHLFTVYHPKAQKIKRMLVKRNIQTRTVYPHPIHKMKAYSNFIKNKNELKYSEKFTKYIFCLPLYPEISKTEINKICNTLISIIKKV